MGLFNGKKGVIMGVANEYSIATGVAKVLAAEGATLGFSHLPDVDGRGRMEHRVRRAIDSLNPAFILPCDVTKDEDVEVFFGKVREHFGQIDFFVHSIAYAPMDDIRCPTLNASRKGFLEAMDISAYSFLVTARHASAMMSEGGSMITMTYIGGEKVIPGYNLMGVCKAALEACVKYVAFDLGPKGLRVNGLSAGPIRTLAASGLGDLKSMLAINAAIAPLGKTTSQEDVGRTAAFLLSNWAGSITGENVHVDCGFHTIGSPNHAIDKLAEISKKMEPTSKQ